MQDTQTDGNRKTALVLGATGLTGAFLLSRLLVQPCYEKVVVLGRRPAPVTHPRLMQHSVDFSQPESFRQLVQGDELFCCLGTTMAKAGSKENFYRVDFTIPFQVAEMASQQGIKKFLLLSSVGASADSLFFYSKVKGELEEAVQKLDFWSIHIFRPSVLLGQRQEKRPAERAAAVIMTGLYRFTGGFLPGRYRPVKADTVAQSMLEKAQLSAPGVYFYEDFSK